MDEQSALQKKLVEILGQENPSALTAHSWLDDDRVGFVFVLHPLRKYVRINLDLDSLPPNRRRTLECSRVGPKFWERSCTLLEIFSLIY